jgi:hypothetical protein
MSQIPVDKHITSFHLTASNNNPPFWKPYPSPHRLLPASNFHQNLDLTILIMNQTLEPLLLHLRQLNPLRNHFRRLHTPTAQRIEHLLEIADLVRRYAHVRSFLEIKIIRLNRTWFLPDGDIHNTSPCARRVDSLIQCGLYACAVIYDMCALPICEFARASYDICFRRIDNMVCAESRGEFLALATDFAHDDVVAAFGFEREDCGYANGSAAQNQRCVTGLVGRDLDGVPAYCEGFDERADLKGHIIWQMVQRGGGHDDVVCETAAPAGEADEAVLPTAVLEAFGASAAGVVVYDGLDHDPVAGFIVGDIGADFFDSTAEFMTECQGHRLLGYGVGRGWTEIGAAEVLVEVWWVGGVVSMVLA